MSQHKYFIGFDTGDLGVNNGKGVINVVKYEVGISEIIYLFESRNKFHFYEELDKLSKYYNCDPIDFTMCKS